MVQVSRMEEHIKALKDIHIIYLFNDCDREKTITDVMDKYNCKSSSATMALDTSRHFTEVTGNEEVVRKSEEIYNIYISNDNNIETTIDSLLLIDMYSNRRTATLAVELSIALHNIKVN